MACRRLVADPLWNTRQGLVVVAFKSFAFFFVFLSAVQIILASEPQLPQVGPKMMQDEFEPLIAGLFLLVNFWFVYNVSSLNLSPLIAGVSFEKMLPSYFVLRIDESSEDGFLVVGIHQKVLVGEGSPDSLDKNESEAELSVMDDQSLS